MFDMNTQVTGIKLVSLILQETGTFEQQHMRPYEAINNMEGLSVLSQKVEMINNSNPGCQIAAEDIAGLSSGMIQPSSNIEGVIPIINGWQQRRFRFTLVIEDVSRLAPEIYQFTGFSEYFDVSHGNHIDPNMAFFINSYNRLRRSADPALGRYVDTIVESQNIVNGRMMIADNQHQLLGIRQKDIFSGLQSMFINGALNTYNNSGAVIDTRNGFETSVFASNRKAAIPSAYLAGIIDTYRNAQSTIDFGQGVENVYDRCISTSHGRLPIEVRFLRELSALRGTTTPVNDFSIGELLRLDPTFAQRISYQPVDDLNQLSVAGYYAPWDGRDRETLIATTLARAVPAVMVTCGLITAHFSATNMTLTGEALVEMIAPGITVSTENPVRNYNMFLQKFRTEILPDITMLNRLPISVMVSADTTNEIHIVIQVDNGYKAEYRYPCFCDSLLQPVMTYSQDTLTNMVVSTEEILNYCGIAPSIDGDLMYQTGAGLNINQVNNTI